MHRFLLFLALCGFSCLVSAARVGLAWNASESSGESTATGYKAYWGPTPGGPYPNSVDVGNELTTMIPNIGEGWTYFVVTAYNSSGESGYSNEASVNIPSPPPPPIVVDNWELVYRVTFEDGTTDASVGTSYIENRGEGQTTLAVSNPRKDSRNRSNMVAQHTVPPGYVRAELSSQTVPTEGETLRYKWQTYVPADADESGIVWASVMQLKVWPCAFSDSGDTSCSSPGHRKDIMLNHEGICEVRARVPGRCSSKTYPLVKGRWVSFRADIKWSKERDGYFKFYKDSTLFMSRTNVPTLAPNWPDVPGCNNYFSVGLYMDTSEGYTMYSDNLEIWKLLPE